MGKAAIAFGLYRPAPEISSPNDEARRVPNILPPRRVSVAPRHAELPIPQARARMSYQNPQRNRRNTAPPLGAAELAATRLGRSGDYKNGRLDSWLDLAY